MFCDDCCLGCSSVIGEFYFNSSCGFVVFFSLIIIESSHWDDYRMIDRRRRQLSDICLNFMVRISRRQQESGECLFL